MKLVQKINSVYITDNYSANAKINSVMRTLIALHGYKHIWTHVSDYIDSEEGRWLSADELWNLYQSTKWVSLIGDISK